MSNPALSILNSAFAAARPLVVLCLALSGACSFDAGKLRAPSSRDATARDGDDVGLRDLGTDSAKASDLATSAEDGPSAGEVTGATGDGMRETEPDASGAADLFEDDGAGDAGQDQDDAPMVDPNDAKPGDVGADKGTGQTAEVPVDGTSVLDGITRGDIDVGRAEVDAPDPARADVGNLVRDALTDVSDTDSFHADTALDSGPAIDPDLVLWYQFDESSGTIAHDSVQFGGVARDATLATVGFGGSATFSSTRQVGTHAVALSPGGPMSNGGGYVVVPAFNTLAPDAVTIAVWVNLAAATSNQTWERIFDFGDSLTAPAWFNLTARSQTSPYAPIFAMSNTGHATADQQRLTGSAALTANAWHHVALVLAAGAPYTGIMYVDGVVAASNSAMSLHLSDIGATSNNWLGRSEYTNDPYFYGSFDDFRVYRRALSQQEIVALMTLR